MVLEKVTHKENISEREVLENALELYIIKQTAITNYYKKKWEFCN
jgi:hypothetical protein